jgi:hypothetical protein
VISRNDFAWASWQNSIATNWRQLLNQRACLIGLMLSYRRLERVARDQLQSLLVFVLGGMNSHYQRLRPSTSFS